MLCGGVGDGGSAFAVATSVVSFWQLADTVEGLVEDTAPGSAAPSAATSALSAETAPLLEATHFTVPTTLLATVVEVTVVDGVVVVLVLELDEHPATGGGSDDHGEHRDAVSHSGPLMVRLISDSG